MRAETQTTGCSNNSPVIVVPACRNQRRIETRSIPAPPHTFRVGPRFPYLLVQFVLRQELDQTSPTTGSPENKLQPMSARRFASLCKRLLPRCIRLAGIR